MLRYTDRHDTPELAARIIDCALGEHSIALTTTADTDLGEPAALRRSDGASVYTRHDSTIYTSTEILAAERRILTAAGLSGGHIVDDASIGMAMLEAHAQHGMELNDGQQTLLRDMATSGARVQLALAPAGTGKTTAMAPLASAWANSGGDVIGLAPTAAAAEVLAADLGAPTDTIDKLVQLAGRGGGPPPAADDPARAWFDRIGADTLIVVDEAGMASTAGLDAVIAHATAAGASVRLIGDDKQLASVSAGGVLRDIVAEHGALTLSDVVRFTDPVIGAAEGAASLALRDGDPTGIAFYLDHGRVHVGADHVAADMAYQAWSDAIDADRDALLIAPTNELVAELNERARLDRLRRQPHPDNTRTVTLSDGLTASVGDWILTRSNARWLHIPGGGWVKNGHRWVIRDIDDRGTITVSRLTGSDTESLVRLPARYVATNTTLGYARTINGAQGSTARHECHVVGSDTLTRQQLYVALTRGKAENHIYFSTSESDPHAILTPKATHPPTAVDILSGILRRDGAQVSAHSAQRAELDPFTRLARAADMYTDALTSAAEQLAGTATMARIDAAATALRRRHHRSRGVAGAAPQPRPAGPGRTRPRRRARARLRSARSATPSTPPPSSTGGFPPPTTAPWTLWVRCAGCPRFPLRCTTTPPGARYLGARAELVDRARRTDPRTGPVLDPGHRAGVGAPTGRTPPRPARRDRGVPRRPQRRPGRHPHHRTRTAPEPLRVLPDSCCISASTPHSSPAAAARSAGAPSPRASTHSSPPTRSGPDWPPTSTKPPAPAPTSPPWSTDAMARHGALPDELPAAALWWRLAGTLAPAMLDTANTRLRPAWTAELHRILGSAAAETITADPAWPALVAAVNAADWPPADLLAAAAEYLLDALHDDAIRPDEYARVLTYRVELLTHYAADIDRDIPHTADAAGHSLHEPPQHPAELADPTEPDFVYDFDFEDGESLGDLDFESLSTQRPVLTPNIDIDIVELRARCEDARARARALAAAVLSTRGGPAEQAAADELIALHRRHVDQRPHQHELAHAHVDWISAENTAEAHRYRLSQLERLIIRADTEHDVALAAGLPGALRRPRRRHPRHHRRGQPGPHRARRRTTSALRGGRRPRERRHRRRHREPPRPGRVRRHRRPQRGPCARPRAGQPTGPRRSPHSPCVCGGAGACV